MLKPSENIVKVKHNSRYSLVIAVAKRAREITVEQKKELDELKIAATEKPVELAVRDFVAGKYNIDEPSPYDYE